MYDFVKMMHDAGCDITIYLTLGVITAEEYAEIVGAKGSDSK